MCIRDRASPYHVEYQHLVPGMLGWRERPPRTADVTDGLVHTLVAAELRAGADERDARGAWAVGWNGASVLAYDMHPASNTGAFRHGWISLGHTQRPNIADPAVNVDVLYDCPDPQAAEAAGMPCAAWVESPTFRYLSSAPRSRHPGGVVALWGDGHVTFLSDDVDEIGMSYLIAIDDGRRVEP